MHHHPTFAGTVKPPANMMEAAQRDLSPEGFERLMKQTEGKPPTADQLVALVEEERNART